MEDERTAAPKVRKGLSPGTWRALIAAGVPVLVLAAFVLQNQTAVDIHFLFGTMRTSLIWALLLAAGLGFAAGFLVARRGR